jgi:hypothetical protein
MPRLCGADRGVAPYPLKCGSDGYVYEHEVANDYGTMVPFLEGGPLLMGNGDNVFYAQQIVPDDKTVGDVTATFKTRFYPDDADTSYGPYTLSSHTDVRFGGRQMRVRFDGAVATDWRIGTPRIDVTQGGGR